jgi:aminobenzoyl-glutamate transport protein
LQTTSELPRWLGAVEKWGNRLPHPTLLFVWLCVLLLPLTALLAAFDLNAQHPGTQAIVHVNSLLSADGIRYLLTHVVSNFIQFAPLGVVLVAMLGIGIAEQSGLLGAVLSACVQRSPPWLLTPAIAFAGVMSSITLDAGYVVLIPLAGLLFLRAGRSPLAGIAIAFAGVSGGFSANLFIGPVDALLAGLTSEAAHIIDPERSVNAAGNYWFILASTVLVTAIITLVANTVTPMALSDGNSDTDQPIANSLDSGKASCENLITAKPTAATRTKANRLTLITALLYFGAIVLLTLPENAVLRDPASGSLISGPFMHSIVVLVSIGFAVCGIVYGYACDHFRQGSDVIAAMEESMRSMAGYLVLMFFAAQFVSWFNWSGLGLVTAIHGASWLGSLQLPNAATLVIFVLFSALINLMIGSASAKWSMLAPIFIPMMMLVGISPEATQAAFRVGDSSTNIITPLMPYFALVLGFARRYQPNTGIGNLMALMLPFSLALLIGWSVFLFCWIAMGWALGPGL